MTKVRLQSPSIAPPKPRPMPAPVPQRQTFRGFADEMSSGRGTALRARLTQLGTPNLPRPIEPPAPAATPIIGPSIGVAGPAPVPTMATLDQSEQTATIAGTANVRPESNTTGGLSGQFANGTTVTIVAPQPEGGAEGWIYTSGTGANGQPLEGWVADGYRGIDLVRQNAQRSDPRVQARLEALGYVGPGGEADPEAVRNFQLMNGLEGTGTVDDATLRAMWSPNARVSTHLVQVSDADYNHSSDAPSRSNNCGPTSVAMALAAAGIAPIDNADPQAAIDAAREAAGGGSGDRTGPGDLEDGVTAAGGESYRVDSEEALQTALTNGDPVVLFGNTYGGHWVTVLGYDAATNSYLVSDPMSHDGVARWSEEKMDGYANYSVDSVAVHNPNG
jgi:hypothetical protein